MSFVKINTCGVICDWCLLLCSDWGQGLHTTSCSQAALLAEQTPTGTFCALWWQGVPPQRQPLLYFSPYLQRQPAGPMELTTTWQSSDLHHHHRKLHQLPQAHYVYSNACYLPHSRVLFHPKDMNRAPARRNTLKVNGFVIKLQITPTVTPWELTKCIISNLTNLLVVIQKKKKAWTFKCAMHQPTEQELIKHAFMSYDLMKQELMKLQSVTSWSTKLAKTAPTNCLTTQRQDQV